MKSRPTFVAQSLNKQLLPFICFSLLAVTSAVPSFAAALTVINTNDDGPGSLRNAIATANSGDTINFNLPNPSTITLTSAVLEINKNLTITGPGQTQLAIDASSQSRGFSIDPGVNVSLSDLTVKNALGTQIYSFKSNLTFSRVTVSGLPGPQFGPGVDNEYGSLMLTNCTISNIKNESAYNGGSLVNTGSATVINSVISGGSSSEGSSGIQNIQGTMTLIGSTVSGNTSSGVLAGGIGNYGTMTILNSTIAGNTSIGNDGVGGGGIFNEGLSR